MFRNNIYLIIFLCYISAQESVAQTASSNITEVSPQKSNHKKDTTSKTPISPSQKAKINADNAIYYNKTQIIHAWGNVKISYKTYTLFSDEVKWDKKNNIITAKGNVKLIEGNKISKARRIVIKGQFKESIIYSLSSKLQNNSYIVAKNVLLHDNGNSYFEDATYTLCLPCESKPDSSPIWRIRSKQASYIKEKGVYKFKDNQLEFFGIPIIYLPDVSLHSNLNNTTNKSGFLTPTFGQQGSLGLFLALPFYWHISDSNEMIITSIFYANPNNGNKNLLLKDQFKQHLGNGMMEINSSYIHPDNDIPENKSYPKNRWNVQGKINYNINKNWRLNSEFNAVSDNEYLEKYGLQRGDYTDELYLPSSLLLERFSANSYFETNTIYFRDTRAETIQKKFNSPYLLNYDTYYYYSPLTKYDTYYNLETGFMRAQHTNNYSINRFHINTSLQKSYIYKLGTNIESEIGVVAAQYFKTAPTDISLQYQKITEKNKANYVVPYTKIKVSHPLIRNWNLFSQKFSETFIPILQLKIAPNMQLSSQIPNVDSPFQEIDSTNLLETNRFTGYDRFETGSRLDYAIDWGLHNNKGKLLNIFVGQSYRLNSKSSYLRGSGLYDHSSDIVGSIQASPFKYLTLKYNFRMDPHNYTLRRSESSFRIGDNYLNTTSSYTSYDTVMQDVLKFQPYRQVYKEIYTTVNFRPYKNWLFSTSIRYSILPKPKKITEFNNSFSYDDECIRLGISLSKKYSQYNDIKNENVLLISLKIKSITSFSFSQELDKN